MIKVIIAGGRDFANAKFKTERGIRRHQTLMAKSLEAIFTDTDYRDIQIVNGTCQGANKAGEAWAVSNGLEVIDFPADWEKDGRGAGFKRNAVMAEYATHCIVFWDGKSKGTEMMINLAKKKNLALRIIRY